ncbi:hypothetical protein [Coraliomargarita parva]|uniref:hypothetical protein n=1 Tax=Coraliomargarita parva TaxID=3014050 RepID=UPI0022B5D906|nr:hypothetical protein [Coraliomargarita parva]
MKNFIFGFISAIAALACVALGALFIFGEKVEEALNGPWHEKEKTELQLTFYPAEDIDLRVALGMDAVEIAEFLSQGNEEKKESYLSLFRSGLSIEIVSERDSDGIDRTQKLYFADGEVGNNVFEMVSKVELIRSEITAPRTCDLQGVKEILTSPGDEELEWNAAQIRLSVDELEQRKGDRTSE